MLRYSRPRVHVSLSLLVILVAVCQATRSTKPTISPSNAEIVIDEGDPLEITCTGTDEIQFVYPDDSGEEANTSIPTTSQDESNGVYKYVFERPNTTFGDTGWYGCADHRVEITPNVYDQPEVNWLYVYVRSNTSLFVQADIFAALNAIAGESVVIPCRPTSPDLEVTLISRNEDELRRKTSFDPRIGFTITNLLVKDSDWIKCAIDKDGREHSVNYVLSVHMRQELPEPRIHDENLHHVTPGEDLKMNCTIHVDIGMRYVLTWVTPLNDSRISIRQYTKALDGGNVLVNCELMIRNVTNDDAGEYKCVIRSLYGSKQTTKNITIHDPEIRYINLTAQSENRFYMMHTGSEVTWVVHIDGYPKPEIQWFNPKGEIITEGSKYFMNKLSKSVSLAISSLKLLDSGVYTLEAKNYYITEKLNFTLEVTAPPLTLLLMGESFYTLNQTALFHCNVVSSPEPNIMWSFRKCPNYPSLENSTLVELTDIETDVSPDHITSSAAKPYTFVSKARIPIEMSGQITCKACNTLGCDNATENVLVSDGAGLFGVIGPTESVAEGDNVEMICAASVYNFTDSVDWLDRMDVPILETERFRIVRHKTPFTYRSTLTINNVQRSDSQVYTCLAKYTPESDNSESIPSYATYTLVVHDTVPPYFNKINMNETRARTIDVTTESHKTVILQCFADGMPKPRVTWYKDDELLKANEQYFFAHDDQELNIRYISQQDDGMYSCHATNRLGVKKAYQQITIKNGKWQKLDSILTISIAILGVVVVILAIYFTIKIRREKKMRKELIEAGLMHFEEGALECLNPDLTVDDQAELLPYDRKFEFSRERLKLGKQLGSGAFGVVMKAEAQGICEDETVTTVAVKMVRRTTVPTHIRALASELKIMVHLGKHLNVVNLLGACTKNISKRELLVIVEYCHFGNLHNYLLRHRADFINQIDPNTGKIDLTIGMEKLTRTASVGSNNSLSANSGTDTVHYCPGTDPDTVEISLQPDGCVLSDNSSQPAWRSNYRGDYKDQNLKPICTQDLLSWAFQVARGMEYLSERRVLHGDLAARNILLAENNVVKICDFGLAKTMYKDGDYKKKGDGPLPIKWMAIESIRDRIFSTQSDIWSFGIVLWEFFTLAETPYPGMEAEKQYQKLIEGYRMEQPEYAIREVYDIMLQCWKAKPTLRPSFTSLVENIGDLLEESVKAHYISLNTPYMDMNAMILEGGKNDYLTMMSAPDHAALSSPMHNYANSPPSEIDSMYLRMSPSYQTTDESGIFSPRPYQDRTHFDFPASPVSDSEDAVELSPMLKQEEPYLQPINVHERRAEFARQRQALKERMANDRPAITDRDSGYCNTPRNLHLIDLNSAGENDDMDERDGSEREETVKSDDEQSRKKDYTSAIISTQDNYVNMPKQKSELQRRGGMPDSFSNPSYVMISSREMDQAA